MNEASFLLGPRLCLVCRYGYFTLALSGALLQGFVIGRFSDVLVSLAPVLRLPLCFPWLLLRLQSSDPPAWSALT